MWNIRTPAQTAAIFDRHFSEYGKAFDLVASDNPLRVEANMARRIAATYWPPQFATSMGFNFDCVVYHSYEPNAFAAYRDGEHWTGISTSLVYVLAELAVRMAAVFPIGDPDDPPLALIGADGAGFRFKHADFAHPKEDAARFFRQAHAFGPLRRRLLNVLWLDSQVLVWRHELFHATLGHTRFLQSHFGIGSLTEAPRNGTTVTDGDVSRMLRALEFHADWAAFGSVLKMATSNHDAAGSDLRKRLGDRWRAASMIASVIMLPAFFGAAEERGAPAGIDHPSAAARLSIFLSRIGELSDPALRDEWRRGSGIALRVFDELSRQHPDFAQFGMMLSEESLSAADVERIACIDDFDSLQNELVPFAALPLGHPHQGGVDPLPGDDAD